MQALKEEYSAADAQFYSLRAVLKVLKEQNHKLVKAGMVRPLDWQTRPPAAAAGLH